MTHEKFEGERTLMRIHIGESDKWHGKPLYDAIVEMLRKDGFSGVTVLRGVAGYGGASGYYTHKNPPPSPHPPHLPPGISTTPRLRKKSPRPHHNHESG